MSAQEMGSCAYWESTRTPGNKAGDAAHDAVEAAFAEGRIDEEAKIADRREEAKRQRRS